jgi:SAM-dependent methyltransferase
MTVREDAYLGFAGHYDLHGWDWFSRVYGPKLIDLIGARCPPAAKVLDAGCGTGTLALRLAAAGHEVTGIDLSEAMLAVARLKDAGAAVTWRRADVTDFDLAERGPGFDLVTCVADILNHLETLEAWESAFRRFASHLRPGGRLIFDVMTCRGLSRLNRFSVEESEGRTLIVEMIYEPRARRSIVKATSFIPAGKGPLYERASETIPEWGHPVAAILSRLAASGFTSVERLWPAGEDPELEDRLIVFSTRR